MPNGDMRLVRSFLKGMHTLLKTSLTPVACIDTMHRHYNCQAMYRSFNVNMGHAQINTGHSLFVCLGRAPPASPDPWSAYEMLN